MGVLAQRRDGWLSPTAFDRSSKLRSAINESFIGGSEISFRTASIIRSKSASPIARSIAPAGTGLRRNDKMDRARDRSPRKFVV
jgi:hypothetical protein